jgi:hypothetical protein
MAENTEDLGNTPEPQEEVSTNNEPEYSDVEKRAMEQGWVPKEQYSGTGKWRDAEEFLDRGELFSKIDDLNRKNRSLETTVHEVKRHYKKIAEAEYNRALRELRAQKKDALDIGDSERVVQIDEAIQNTKVQQAQELRQLDATPQMPPAENPVFMVWQNRNPWYSQDRAMKVFADTLGEELVVKHGMHDPKEVLAEIERQVKKEFSHKFNNPNRNKPGAVEGGGKSGGGKSNEAFQLTAEETQVMNKFVKNKVMTKEEYIAEIKASRGV